MDQVLCPRCGYDQQGALEAWRGGVAAEGEGACCPVNGVCSECGLRFAWGSLLNPELRAASWLFEHVKGARRVVKASLLNGVSALDGRAWWRRVRLEHAVKPWRLVVHWLVWAVVTHIGLGVMAGVFQVWAYWYRWYRYRPAWGAATWTDSYTLETVKGGAQAALWPWKSFAYGYRYWNKGVDASDFLTLILISTVVTAAAFLLLPSTLRRVKVRPAHLVRGLGHAAPVASAAILVWGAGCAAMNVVVTMRSMLQVDIGAFHTPDRVVVLSLVVFAWAGVWWWSFTREYLRLPRAGLVASLLTVLAFLAAVALFRVVPEWLGWVWDWIAWQFAGLKLKLMG